MDGGDGGLELVGTAGGRSARSTSPRPSSIVRRPRRAVLFLEHHEPPAGPIRAAAGVVEEHQGEQADGLGLVGHEGRQDARQADGLGAEVAPHATRRPLAR